MFTGLTMWIFCVLWLMQSIGKDDLLTLKALGFFLPVQQWGVFCTPSVKLDPDIPEC